MRLCKVLPRTVGSWNGLVVVDFGKIAADVPIAEVVIDTLRQSSAELAYDTLFFVAFALCIYCLF